MTSFEVTYNLQQEIDLSTIGARLKHARLNKGLTIKKLSKMVGVNEVTLGQWEKNNGEIENYSKRIKYICQILGVNVEYIFDELDNNSFASILKRSRFEMGLSRRELASALGVDRGTVKEWEEGNKPRKYTELEILDLINKLRRRYELGGGNE